MDDVYRGLNAFPTVNSDRFSGTSAGRYLGGASLRPDVRTPFRPAEAPIDRGHHVHDGPVSAQRFHMVPRVLPGQRGRSMPKIAVWRVSSPPSDTFELYALNCTDTVLLMPSYGHHVHGSIPNAPYLMSTTAPFSQVSAPAERGSASPWAPVGVDTDSQRATGRNPILRIRGSES